MAIENGPLLPTKEKQESRESPTLFITEIGEAGDIRPIKGRQEFCKEFLVESRKLWYLAGPAIFTSICQYSFGAVTQMVAGQVSTLALAAVSVENSVIANFSLGVLMGMGSALETLCGQAYGAGHVELMGVYLQRSWVILFVAALGMTPLYIFAGPILRLIGQQDMISDAVGQFALWMIPQLFAFAMNFPIAKFLQAQSHVLVMTYISVVVLLLHALLSWLFVVVLGWGLPAAAVMLNLSWWLVVIGQLVYILWGACGRAWSGFTWKAFHNLGGFCRLSLASAVMLCLEIWYFMVLVIFAGYLKNAEVSVDALSICMNILGWTAMVAVGFNAAISVRVSNELGAGHPRTAKFSVEVVIITSLAIGIMISLNMIATRRQFPVAFSRSREVQDLVFSLTPLLATSVVANNVQPVISGVAVGAGWQALVAYVNFGCYYLFGLPIGLIMGYELNLGVEGIWCGMLSGTILQTVILFWMSCRTNWEKEATIAGGRIRKWGGEAEEKNCDQTLLA